MHCDIDYFTNELLQQNFSLNISQWLEKLVTYKCNIYQRLGIDGKAKIPNQIIKFISQSSSDNDMICVDVGQHQMWVAQSFDTKAEQRVLFSGGMGAMGFALPTASWCNDRYREKSSCDCRGRWISDEHSRIRSHQKKKFTPLKYLL